MRFYLSLIGLDTVDLMTLVARCMKQIQSGEIAIFVWSHEMKNVNIPYLSFFCIPQNLIQCIETTDLNDAFAKTGRSVINLIVHDLDRYQELTRIGHANGVTTIRFYQLNAKGELELCPAPHPAPAAARIQQNPMQQRRTGGDAQPSSRFQIKTEIDNAANTALSVDSDIQTGDCLFSREGKAYRLKQKKLVNRDSVTYETDVNGIWIKVFRKEDLTTFKEAKLRKMISIPIEKEGICWPLDIVRDGSGVFRGYLMKEASGLPLLQCMLNAAGIRKTFPNWNKKDLTVLTRTILQKICFMHEHGILFGCINPAAIRVADENKVYFVDADRFQIEGYPSVNYNLSFLAPEYLGKKVFLATLDGENFAVAELVFMLMMIGQTPYGEGIISNPEALLQKQEFLYPGQSLNSNTGAGKRYFLPGSSRFMWSHLTPFKQPMYETFQKEEKHNKVGTRLNEAEWLRIVQGFYNQLERRENQESTALFPKTYKRMNGDQKFYPCNYCGVEHPEFFFSRQKHTSWGEKRFPQTAICNECIYQESKTQEGFTCELCKRTYTYTNEAAIYHQVMRESDETWSKQKYCEDCKRKVRACAKCRKLFPYYKLRDGLCPDCNRTTVYCARCRKQFEMTISHKDELQSQGRKIYCSECQDERKSMTSVYCKRCRGWFEITVGQKEYLEEKGMDFLCEGCKRKKNEIYREIRCKDCGRLFSVTYGQMWSYEDRGFDQPKRCPDCKNKRRY